MLLDVDIEKAKEEEKYDVIEKQLHILDKVKHQNIVRQFYHWVTDDSHLKIIAEHLPCFTLEFMIKACGGKLSLDLTKFYTVEIVKALSYLKKDQVVHRDLKPRNIMLDQAFHPKLVGFDCAISKSNHHTKMLYKEARNTLKQHKGDFSEQIGEIEVELAEEFDTSESKSMKTVSKSSGQIGTLPYMSPEMLCFKIASHEADVWALGCLVYQCLFGEPPFKGDDVVSDIKNCKFEFPEDFDSDAKDFIESCIKINPFERIGSGSKGLGKTLLSHPFLQGIEHEDIDDLTPPVPEEAVEEINSKVLG